MDLFYVIKHISTGQIFLLHLSSYGLKILFRYDFFFSVLLLWKQKNSRDLGVEASHG